MNKLGIRGRRWLKAFHVLFSMTWIGAAITINIIPFVTRNTISGAELYAYNEAIKMGDLIIIPCAVLCLITGLLLCWQTPWGFSSIGQLLPHWPSGLWYSSSEYSVLRRGLTI